MAETKKTAASKDAADKTEKARNEAAKNAANPSVVGNMGGTPAQRSGLEGVPNSVLNPAFVIVED